MPQATLADSVWFVKYPMLMLGDLEQFGAEDLHPYRWLVTVGLLFLPVAIIVLAYHRGWHVLAWRHRLAMRIAAVVVLAVAIPVVDQILSPPWDSSVLQDEISLSGDQLDDRPDNGREIASPRVDPWPAHVGTPNTRAC